MYIKLKYRHKAAIYFIQSLNGRIIWCNMYSERARVGHNLLQQLLLNNNEHHKHFPFPLKGINVIQRLCFCVNVSQGPLVTHEDTKVTALFAKLAKLIFLCCNRRQSDICSCLFPLSAVAEVPISPTLPLPSCPPANTNAGCKSQNFHNSHNTKKYFQEVMKLASKFVKYCVTLYFKYEVYKFKLIKS